MFQRKSLKWPIFLAVTMIVLLVSLMVGWVLLNVFGWQRGELSTGLYWVLLSAGSAMFTCVVVGVVLYLILAIQQINLNRRQSNFIDAVTHELKSPIASIKLTLQTLRRRSTDETQRQTFYDAMLQDTERLDQLISQLLDVARLSHRDAQQASEISGVRVDHLLGQLVCELESKYFALEREVSASDGEPSTSKRSIVILETKPITLECMRVDLDILFRNLIDNAFKYAGKPPQIEIKLGVKEDQTTMVASISDNGPGIPRAMRRRVFNRFFRIGDELERKKPGTGLGLFLVRTVVKRLRGRIQIVDHPNPAHSGTRFEITIPNAQIE